MNITFMKFLVESSFLLVLVFLIKTVLLGRDIKHIRNYAIRSRAEEKHEKSAKITFWLAIIAIVITEVMVRLGGGLIDIPLFIFHMCFATPFLLSLIALRFWVTGRTNKNLHKILGYTCLGTFIVALITGGILLYQFK